MADDPVSTSAAGAPAAASPLDPFHAAVGAAMDCVTNLRWDDAETNLAHLRAVAARLPAEFAVVVDAFVEPVVGFVTGNRLLAAAKTEAERAAALEHLKSAQAAVRERRLRLPELAGNPGYFQFALGIESQVYSVQGRLARARGDAAEAEQCQAKIFRVFDEMLAVMPEGDPQRCYLLACRKIPLGVNRVQRGLQAAAEMNLDQACAYLAEGTAAFDEVSALYAKVTDRSGLVQGMVRLGDGLQLYARALRAYIDALHTSVVGDLTRGHLARLAEAERAALEGTEIVTQSVATMPGLFEQADLRREGVALATLIRNLRALGERSLSPKQLSRSASPRAIVYFLGTFLVLALALPFSGLVERLDFTGLGFLLVISLVVALIGAFGFESTRLLPWFDTLAKFVPGAGAKDEEKAPAADEAKP